MDKKFFAFEKPADVSPELRVFFADPKTAEKLDSIANWRQLTPSQHELLFRVMKDIVRGRITDEDIAALMEEKGGMDFAAALELQGDIYIEVLSEVEDQLAEQHAVHRDLHPEDFLPPAPPETDPFIAVAKEVAEKSGFASVDEVLKKRLEQIIVSFFKEVRKEGDVLAMLEKPVKTGGMSFLPEQAQTILALTKEAAVKVATKREEIDRQLAARRTAEEKVQTAKKKAAVGAAPKVTKGDLGLDFDQDAAEIAASARRASPNDAPLLDALVEEAVRESGVAFPDTDAERRFRTLTGAFFRDLRDEVETRTKLMAPFAGGGLNLSEADADRVMGALKMKLSRFGADQELRVKREKDSFVTARVEKMAASGEIEQQKETAAVEKMYAQIVGKSKGRGIKGSRDQGVEKETLASSALAKKPSSPPALQPSSPPKMIKVVSEDKPPTPPAPPDVGAPPKADRQATAVPGMNGVRQAPPPPNLPILGGLENAVTAAMPAPKPIPAPTPAKPTSPRAHEPAVPPPVITARQLPPVVPGTTRPVVTDVISSPKLVGPVEELRVMTLADFRALSRDPKEATLKIRDKIDLLGEQSFDMRQRGARAWQESGANRAYLELLRCLLGGQRFDAAVADLKAKGQQPPSRAEFDAMMELNRGLRFG